MNSFMELVQFEYLKLIRKKSVKIAVIIGFILIIFSVYASMMGSVYINGELFESHYQAMITDRENARALSGRTLDTPLLLEAAAAYDTIPEEAAVYESTDAYQQTARKYSSIFRFASKVYTLDEEFTVEHMRNLTEKQAAAFYDARMEAIRKEVADSLMSSRAKDAVMERADKAEKPLIYSYADGYSSFCAFLYTTGIVAAFIIAICVAPLFAGEYASGADQLILSSRFGKGKLIGAKLFTGFTFAALLTFLFILLSYIECMAVFGSDGKDSMIQCYDILSTYPLTMGKTVLLQSICVLLACIFIAGVTMFLSAKLKSSFSVIILATIFLCGPMMIYVSEKPLLPYLLFNLLPANMMAYWSVMDYLGFEIIGVLLPNYIVMPVFAAGCTALLTPFTYRGFKKHQIG